jgi:hypothetical protein
MLRASSPLAAKPFRSASCLSVQQFSFLESALLVPEVGWAGLAGFLGLGLGLAIMMGLLIRNCGEVERVEAESRCVMLALMVAWDRGEIEAGDWICGKKCEMSVAVPEVKQDGRKLRDKSLGEGEPC